jgi:hypothetical protein
MGVDSYIIRRLVDAADPGTSVVGVASPSGFSALPRRVNLPGVA